MSSHSSEWNIGQYKPIQFQIPCGSHSVECWKFQGVVEVNPKQSVVEVCQILLGLNNAFKYLKYSLKSVECKWWFWVDYRASWLYTKRHLCVILATILVCFNNMETRVKQNGFYNYLYINIYNAPTIKPPNWALLGVNQITVRIVAFSQRTLRNSLRKCIRFLGERIFMFCLMLFVVFQVPFFFVMWLLFVLL